jgi:hypothetical protein
MDLVRGLKPRGVARPKPLQQARPDTFTVSAGPDGGITCGTSGAGPKCGTPWNTTPTPDPRCGTPWNTAGGAPAPTQPPGSTPPSTSGPVPNPFEGGKGLTGPLQHGPFFTLGKPDASTTWAQLAQLFAEGRVIGDTGGSCGMTSAQKIEALRSFWGRRQREVAGRVRVLRPLRPDPAPGAPRLSPSNGVTGRRPPS